ncbi:2'-5' RNA ligase family protein [Nocardioides sp. MAH-18]|uniref:2'-5' RNA ligase family protein n=1 Tax=Nocardioides agri TaxID=2682843 RepID=A0A6L6XZ99_9ACTN|nr:MULTISPECIES: 2'-5' RNA ligase family protein [unclassified Nocardioides]MBA2952930.1 2'-5' RNA ligase family protein [Nocardioides sp. CGMCC 1.13656]MVQ52092.1 2'-5' RNA ligase family protein [Nocardioides sp. MAH-18]
MAHTVLLVPVPEFEEFVRGRTRHYDASFLSTDPDFVHAHITVLGPFLDDPGDADLRRVGAVAAAAAPFDFELTRVEEFPDGLLHLRPAPDAAFRALTARLVAAFPQCPPYAGAYPDPVPHLTLDQRGDGIDAATVEAALAGTLPARCRADRIALHRYANHDCRVLSEWKLGAS